MCHTFKNTQSNLGKEVFMKENNHAKNSLNTIVSQAVQGDGDALEYILSEINDFVFNLSLRMLGTIADAEDASQDILIKIITNLSSFKQKSNFKTWVYRIACNYLLDYKKSMFSQFPLDFNYYENDIQSTINNESTFEEENQQYIQELKLSCTNVLLQCLSPKDRCIFILGTMFTMNSTYASELLEIRPAIYRKRLSRSKQKVQEFLSNNCGLSTGNCSCKKE